MWRRLTEKMVLKVSHIWIWHTTPETYSPCGNEDLVFFVSHISNFCMSLKSAPLKLLLTCYLPACVQSNLAKQSKNTFFQFVLPSFTHLQLLLNLHSWGAGIYLSCLGVKVGHTVDMLPVYHKATQRNNRLHWTGQPSLSKNVLDCQPKAEAHFGNVMDWKQTTQRLQVKHKWSKTLMPTSRHKLTDRLVQKNPLSAHHITLCQCEPTCVFPIHATK